MKLLPIDRNSQYSRIFEIRDDPIQERQGQNNRCLNRNPSLSRVSLSVLKVYYCPGTNTPNTYLIDLVEIGIDVNDWFNVLISVSKKAGCSVQNHESDNIKQKNDGAKEQSKSYEFDIKLSWRNLSFSLPNMPYEFQNAKMSTNADLYIYKRPNVQVGNFQSTGLKFIAENPSFW